jgi:hypothetical protein
MQWPPREDSRSLDEIAIKIGTVLATARREEEFDSVLQHEHMFLSFVTIAAQGQAGVKVDNDDEGRPVGL